MFPFWEVVIEPVLKAARATRVVEIGALAGDNTKLMLGAMESDAELHVIDPLPQFDPEEHRRQFGGRYIFHRDLSLNVLLNLPPMDAALIDGDHNWYTVYNECKQLAEVTEAADRPLPLLFLHDTFWPYGRRDLYYAPEQIPEEFRQPWTRGGMRQGQKKLAKKGGLNPQMANADIEGGPRNGVMTGLEDFLEEFPHPVRRIDLPIYFGMSIVADQRMLDANPELVAALDQVESAEGQRALLELSEDIRLKSAVWQHTLNIHSDEKTVRATNRYLDMLDNALLNEHYLEHELRIDYLLERAEGGKPVDAEVLRDPMRALPAQHRQLTQTRRNGPDAGSDDPGFGSYAASGNQLDLLRQALDSLSTDHVRGDLIAVGAGRGGAAIFMRGYLEAMEDRQRTVWVVDNFSAIGEQGQPGADLNAVRDAFDRFDLLDDQVKFLQGDPATSIAGADLNAISILRVGTDDPDDARATLDALYERVSHDGWIIVDSTAAVAAAVESFRADNSITDTTTTVEGSSVVWRKRTDVNVVPQAAHAGHATPLIGARENELVDLSVIVTLHNMRREGQRTLHSLSRHYQRDLEGVDYEVLVVDNGSDADQRFTAADLAQFGAEFRLIDMGPSAPPSPVTALNTALAQARGDAVAMMIDGAHVLSPGVLSNGLRGLAVYEPAIVATQHWYVGPGQQNDAMLDGYDQAFEDQLFEQIDWPRDGYKLFEIGTFIGNRDWFDGMWESNCLFAPRKLVEQVGGFDEAFTTPGGAYANLDIFERLGNHPDITLATILGEASFHQTHGGVTTNAAEIAGRGDRLAEYRAGYEALRGRPFRAPSKPIHYVGHLDATTRRSRARRMSSREFADAAQELGRPLPIPDEARDDFTATVFASDGWQRTSWMGHTVRRAPTDLIAYQEIVAKVRPDVIVVTNSGDDGGLPQFLATICESIGHGRVLAVGPAPHRDDHPRLSRMNGTAESEQCANKVLSDVGDQSALLILGRNRMFSMARTFNRYESIVPEGSYVIFEDTAVNGHPVLPEFGPGPHEAVMSISRERDDFIVDPEPERFGLTFNPRGFLLRTTNHR